VHEQPTPKKTPEITSGARPAAAAEAVPEAGAATEPFDSERQVAVPTICLDSNVARSLLAIFNPLYARPVLSTGTFSTLPIERTTDDGHSSTVPRSTAPPLEC
jgi:hypothetical protein